MAARGVDLSVPVLVRHHLHLPVDAVGTAAGIAAQDGYGMSAPADPGRTGTAAVRLSRTQLLTAMSVSQERARMTGLAQRLDGDALGWDARGPAAPGRQGESASGL